MSGKLRNRLRKEDEMGFCVPEKFKTKDPPAVPEYVERLAAHQSGYTDDFAAKIEKLSVEDLKGLVYVMAARLCLVQREIMWQRQIEAGRPITLDIGSPLPDPILVEAGQVSPEFEKVQERIGELFDGA